MLSQLKLSLFYPGSSEKNDWVTNPRVADSRQSGQLSTQRSSLGEGLWTPFIILPLLSASRFWCEDMRAELSLLAQAHSVFVAEGMKQLFHGSLPRGDQELPGRIRVSLLAEGRVCMRSHWACKGLQRGPCWAAASHSLQNAFISFYFSS